MKYKVVMVGLMLVNPAYSASCYEVFSADGTLIASSGVAPFHDVEDARASKARGERVVTHDDESCAALAIKRLRKPSASTDSAALTNQIEWMLKRADNLNRIAIDSQCVTTIRALQPQVELLRDTASKMPPSAEKNALVNAASNVRMCLNCNRGYERYCKMAANDLRELRGQSPLPIAEPVIKPTTTTPSVTENKSYLEPGVSAQFVKESIIGALVLVVRSVGYTCDSVSAATPFFLSEGYKLHCNHFRYSYEIENKGGRFMVMVK